MCIKQGYKLFKINSTEIYFDPIWIIPFSITSYALSYYSAFMLDIELYSAKPILIGITASFSFFLFSTLHELAHIVIAKKYGLSMKRITFLLGRMDSHISGTPKNWWEEFSVSLFGPIVNLIFVFLFVHLKSMFIVLEISLSNELSLLINYFILINIAIGMFNVLIPALPLDGGRIMRAMLWALTKNYTLATTITLWINALLGIILVAFSIILGGHFYIMGFIGIFILYQSRREQKKLYQNHFSGDET